MPLRAGSRLGITACKQQAEMFREVPTIGGLSVQLVYYRGLSECRSSRWVSQPEHLAGLMERIDGGGQEKNPDRSISRRGGARA
jgi:hypothetical protein